MYLLEDALAPQSCLRLMRLAQQQALPVLEVAAVGLALGSFSLVAAADREGLRALDQDTFHSLLTSKCLQA